MNRMTLSPFHFPLNAKKKRWTVFERIVERFEEIPIVAQVITAIEKKSWFKRVWEWLLNLFRRNHGGS